VEIDPNTLELGPRYRLLISAIVPRPIAFVSTASADGKANIAPFSYFSGVGSNPITMLFCPANKSDGSEKDSLRNAKPVDEGGSGEFIVNATVQSYARNMAATAEDLEYGESEFEFAGLTTAPGRLVKAPRLAQSPISFECKTTQVIRTNPGEHGGGNIVIGEVVWIHVDERIVDERMAIDPNLLQAIGRMGGAEYCTTQDRFTLPRGRAALEKP